MFHIRQASRVEAKPLVGFYAESGAGKTYSSLLLARGFAPDGRIVMIETEGGRGEAYVDIIPGGYEVVSIRNEFSPANFGEAISVVEKAEPHVLIIDSASAEWEGLGGVLSMAADNQAKGLKGPLVWQKPKMDHQRHFMLRILQTPIPLVIICMRAKYPMIERKVGERKEWIRSEQLEPQQAHDILFEMFVHAWIDQQHRAHITKLTHPALARVFIDGEPITAATGERLAVWAKASAPGPAQSPSVEDADVLTSDKINEWKRQLHVVADQGTAALQAKWKMLPKAAQQLLEIEKDKVLKPAAARADAQRRDRARA